MQRTDAIDEWILDRLAEVHPSHELHPFEDENQWQTTCGGCLTQIRAVKHVSQHTYSAAYYKKVFEQPLSWDCTAKKVQIPGKTLIVSDKSGFYAPKTQWEAEIITAMATNLAHTIDQELLNSLDPPKNQSVNSLPIEADIKLGPTWSSLVAEAKQMAAKDDYKGVAKKAATLKKLVAKAQKELSAATPLKQILSDLTAGGLTATLITGQPWKSGEISHG
jgi:hypothetical protein